MCFCGDRSKLNCIVFANILWIGSLFKISFLLFSSRQFSNFYSCLPFYLKLGNKLNFTEIFNVVPYWILLAQSFLSLSQDRVRDTNSRTLIHFLHTRLLGFPWVFYWGSEFHHLINRIITIHWPKARCAWKTMVVFSVMRSALYLTVNFL